MEIGKTLRNWVKETYELDVITRQQLFLKYLEILFADNIYDRNLEKIRSFPNLEFYKLCDYLIDERVLIGFNHNSRGYSYFIKKGTTPTSEMAISALYPLGFLSHLSAMNLYALSNTKSSGIYFTCPNRSDWKKLCLKNIKKRFKGLSIAMPVSNKYIEINGFIFSTQSILDPYPNQKILEEAGSNKALIIINKKSSVESEWWNNCHIQNIVDLYLDMLKAPHYCGGISHVLKIYQDHLIEDQKLLSDILDILDKTGSIIDKARVGCILNKVFAIESSQLDKWKFEQIGKRGSSRKLFSNFEFDSFFDEEWNISINHPTIKNLYQKKI